MRLRRFSQPGSDRPVDRFLEGDARIPRALLQKSREIVVDGQRGTHGCILDADIFDVKTSAHGDHLILPRDPLASLDREAYSHSIVAGGFPDIS